MKGRTPPLRLTRLGTVVVALALAAVAVLALTWAFDSGMDRQCAWWRQHDPARAAAYCH